MNERHYTLMQRLGKNVNSAMSLPCVTGVTKLADGSLMYSIECQNGYVGKQGDLLCRDTNGDWWLEKADNN